MSVTGPSHLRSVKPRMEREEWPVAAAWLLAFFTLTPAPCHGPAPARRRQEKVKRCCSAAWLASTRPSPAQAAANQTFTFLCSPRPSPSPAPQPSCRQFPFTLLELVLGPGQDCHTNVLYHHYLCTQPRHGAMGLYSNIYTYTHTQSQFTSLNASHQSSILCHSLDGI